MASTTPLADGINTPYANITRKGDNADTLQKLLKYRILRAAEDGWEIGEHNCAVVVVRYQIAPNVTIFVKEFFADSSMGNPQDTSSHAERRAWDEAKTWLEMQLKTKIVVNGTKVISELKACSSNENDCKSYFSDGGGATLGNPETTLVFRPTKGDRFYYTNESPEQLTEELSSIQKKTNKAKVEESIIARESKLAQEKRGTKALNVAIEKALSTTSIVKAFSSEPNLYPLFIEAISNSLRKSNNIDVAIKEAVTQQLELGGFVFKGKPGTNRINELSKCFDPKILAEAIKQENAPAWNNAGPRYGMLDTPSSRKKETFATPPPSSGGLKSAPNPMIFSSKGSLAAKGVINIPSSNVGSAKFTLDDIIKIKLSFLNLNPKTAERLISHLERRISEVDSFNKINKHGEPLDIAQTIDKFCYHSNLRVNGETMRTIYQTLEGITSDNIVRPAPPKERPKPF